MLTRRSLLRTPISGAIAMKALCGREPPQIRRTGASKSYRVLPDLAFSLTNG
jgi:hypothetical protein